MNIEEAINYLEENLKNWKADRPNLGNSDIVEEVDKDYRAIETLLTAYEKEKEKNKEILSGNIENFQKYFLEEFDKRFISKNKILEILGIEETDDEKILSLLQTLVDENARLEDIEDKKVQIEYNNVFNKGVKSVEDKIKAKIEEIDFMIKEINQGHLQKYTVGELLGAKRFLESLLEKE